MLLFRFAAAVDQAVMEAMNKRYHDFRVIASYIVDQLPDHPRILTLLWELLIGFVLLIAKERGLCLELICTETRPYLQGGQIHLHGRRTNGCAGDPDHRRHAGSADV